MERDVPFVDENNTTVNVENSAPVMSYIQNDESLLFKGADRTPMINTVDDEAIDIHPPNKSRAVRKFLFVFVMLLVGLILIYGSAHVAYSVASQSVEVKNQVQFKHVLDQSVINTHSESRMWSSSLLPQCEFKEFQLEVAVDATTSPTPESTPTPKPTIKPTYIKEGDTLHFKQSMFQCSHCGNLPKEGISIELLIKLEALRTKLQGKQIVIASGYRCPNFKPTTKTAGTSQHLSGKAADIIVTGMKAKDVAKVAESIFPSGGIGKSKAYTHVDVRNSKARWDE